MQRLPRLYSIADSSLVQAHSGASGKNSAATMARFVSELVEGGSTWIQYRNKTASALESLSEAREIRRAIQKGDRSVQLIMNDRADLCLAAGFAGVHVGQDDLSVDGARQLCPRPQIVGTSTHNAAQLVEADATSADYVAIGPVFVTTSKLNPDPVIGIEGVRAARGLTRKPLVAIGGITRANCREVMEAGADAVAVISDLLLEPRKSCEEFLRLLM